ncbi:MAG TPA: MFS transporter [Ktedonobacteraceae bacterium]|nr:MFS transporter [Ktedonobacteraceae bacterium]
MYTLEDDKETTSSLRKRNAGGPFIAPSANADSSPGSPPVGAQFIASPPNGEDAQHISLGKQVTNSFKKITTPANAQANNKGVALAALTIACIGVFFTAMDQTVVVTALPPIVNDLNIGATKLDHAAWIVSAYLLGFVIAMPLMGRVSDIFGRRRILLICLTIFGIGSILCGLAPVFGQMWDISFLNAINIDTSSPGLIWLIAARFLQAIGGGAVVPVAMAIAGDFYGQERRGLALGIIGAVTEAGGVVGPLYGAVIVQQFGWQYIFYLNVPIVIGLMIGGWFLIPRGTRLHESIDWIGAVLLGLALTCLSLGLAQQGTDLGPTPTNAPTPQNNPISLALAIIFLIAFVLFERKRRWPVVDLSLFKRFPFSATSLVSLLVGAALIIAMADIPIFVDTVLQRPVLDSGLALLRLTAMIPLGALLGGWLCSRITCRFTGVLGLLFTAVGFYLMSRWPINVDWNQITISTITAGFGFGLVIAPIGTTAINAVRARQAGMSSAIVTSLRMVGMMLGLAALTSWALAYFKQLASTYPSLPLTATSAQFTAWAKGYATHIIQSAHTVYSAVFLLSMVICLIAIIPALFLWGNKVAVNEAEAPEIVPPVVPVAPVAPVAPVVPPLPDDETVVGLAATATPVSQSVVDLLQDPAPPTAVGLPPIPPPDDPGGSGGNWGRRPRKRRRMIIALASVLLILLLIIGGVFAAFLWQTPGSTNTATTTNQASATDTPTPTPIAGPRMIQLALDQGALTSLFVSQLGLQTGALTDLKVVPTPNDGLILSLNLHIDANGIHRVMPIEMDSTLGIDKQQNIQLHVLHLKRDGQDAGPAAAASMGQAVNQMLISSLMPALRGELKGVKLISVHTSTSIGCAANTEMLVLLIEAPPIQGIAAQPTPVPFCFKGTIDINKLLPH